MRHVFPLVIIDSIHIPGQHAIVVAVNRFFADGDLVALVDDKVLPADRSEDSSQVTGQDMNPGFEFIIFGLYLPGLFRVAYGRGKTYSSRVAAGQPCEALYETERLKSAIGAQKRMYFVDNYG